MERKNAVIVAFGRSAIAKAIRGSLRYTGCADFGTQVLRGILERNPGFDPALAEDLICGCAIPEAEQGLNIGRLLADSSGFPLTTAGQTVNRFCSSGLQSIASAANAIMAGQAKCIVAGGLENMSKVQMHRVAIIPDSASFGSYPDNFDTMGITAENVAEKYGISRERQDAFACESHRRAAEAIRAGKFKDEIIPVRAKRPIKKEDGSPGWEYFIFDTDECVRPDTTVEGLAKLKPLFRMGGSVTAGNSSQMNDAAAFVVLMEEEFALRILRRARRAPGLYGTRPDRGDPPRAGYRGNDAGRHRSHRAQRGLRVPVAGLHRPARPQRGDRQRQRRRHRFRPSARLHRRVSDDQAHRRAAPPRTEARTRFHVYRRRHGRRGNI